MVEEKTVDRLFLIGSFLVVVGFFMPWVEFATSFMQNVSRFLSQADDVTLMSMSGFDIPKFAHSGEVKLVRSFLRLFVGDVEDPANQAYLVWLVPGLSYVLMWLYVWGQNVRRVYWALAAIALGVSGAGFYQLFTLNMDKIVVKLTISYGLWVSLAGIALMGLCGLLKIVIRD